MRPFANWGKRKLQPNEHESPPAPHGPAHRPNFDLWADYETRIRSLEQQLAEARRRLENHTAGLDCGCTEWLTATEANR